MGEGGGGILWFGSLQLDDDVIIGHLYIHLLQASQMLSAGLGTTMNSKC